MAKTQWFFFKFLVIFLPKSKNDTPGLIDPPPSSIRIYGSQAV